MKIFYLPASITCGIGLLYVYDNKERLIYLLKAVIFDMDGLMINTERLTVKIWGRLGREYGYSGIPEAAPHTMGLRKDASKKFFSEHFGKEFPFDEFMGKSSAISEKYLRTNGVPVMPGLFELLDFLKSKKLLLAVATSTARERAMFCLNDIDAAKYFDKIICGDMVEKSKPDPDIYLKTAAALGAAPSSCAVLEDSPNGAAAGIAAGMATVMVPDLAAPDENLRKSLFACVGSLTETVPIFDKMLCGCRA